MGRSANDHRLSDPPSQPNQRFSRAFHRLGVLRSISPMPAARARASVHECSGAWQCAQENFPPGESLRSKNSARPSAIASALPEARLDGSRIAAGGQGPWRRINAISRSSKPTASNACDGQIATSASAAASRRSFI